MILHRSLWETDKLFFTWDIDEAEKTTEERKAIQEWDYWQVLFQTWFFELGEVDYLLAGKVFLAAVVSSEVYKKAKEEGVEYNIDWINLSRWEYKIEEEQELPLDYLMEKVQKLASEGEIDDMTYVVYRKFFQITKWRKIKIVFFDKSRGKLEKRYEVPYEFVDEAWMVSYKQQDLEGLLVKEWVDWYFNLGTIKVWVKDQVKEVPIGQDIEVEFDGERYKLYGVYTPQIRFAMMKDLFTEKEIEEAKKKWKLKILQWWQYDVLKRWGHVNVVASPRRWWKSFLSTLVWIRELFKHNVKPKPIRVLYYWLTQKKTLTAINYLKSVSKEFRKVGILQWKQWEQKLSYVDPITKDELGVFEFHSADEKEAWVGEYADLIILDEAARIPEDIYDSMKAIIFSEGSRAFIISTIHWNTPKNWFYQLLIRAETQQIKHNNKEYREKAKDILKQVTEKWKDFLVKNLRDIKTELEDLNYKYRVYVARRVTLDEVERLPEYKKQKTKEELQSNPLRYYTEVYSIFPSEQRVFRYFGHLVDIDPNSEGTLQKYERIYIWYDPARAQDNAAVVFVGVYYNDVGKLIFEVFDSVFWTPEQNVRYWEQVERVGEFKQMYDAFLAVDATGIGRVLVEDFERQGYYVDFPIVYTSWNQINRERWVWKVPKGMMVMELERLFDEGHIKINKRLRELIEEMDSFKKYSTQSGQIKYEAEKGHDDLVNAMMIAIFSAYEIDALKMKTHINKVDKADEIARITREYLEELKAKEEERQRRREYSSKVKNLLKTFWF